MIKMYDKNINLELCHGLQAVEFQCRCSDPRCRMTLIDDDLIKAYGQFRFYIGHPIIINDGYRCPEHNYDVGGVSKSYHQTGQAIDISLVGIDLPHDQIERLAKQAGFKFVLFYDDKNFVHLDLIAR